MDKYNNNELWWKSGLALFWRLSVWIGGPIVAAVFLGRYLDNRYNSEPWLFLAAVGISFAISMVMLIRIGFEEFKKIESESQKNPKSK